MIKRLEAMSSKLRTFLIANIVYMMIVYAIVFSKIYDFWYPYGYALIWFILLSIVITAQIEGVTLVIFYLWRINKKRKK
jgi:hypothetical protein